MTDAAPISPPNASRLTSHEVWWLAALLALLSLPTLAGRGILVRIAALGDSATAANPFFVPEHFALLYLATPLVTASAAVLLMAPGLLVAIAIGRARSINEWALWGLLLSLPFVSVPVAVVQGLRGAPVRGLAFELIVLATCFVAAMWAARRAAAAQYVAPWRQPGAGFTTALMLGVPAMLAIFLTPKIHWEAFNGDGAHAFEAARQLLHHPLPFWDPSAGDVSVFPGVTSMLYAWPMSWYFRLFGEIDASARLPFFLYLPALVGAVSALATVRRSSALSRSEQALVWMVVIVFAIVMAYSASYSPYNADLALPATQDTLLVVCVVGALLAFLNGDHPMLVLATVGAFVSLPNGLVLIAFWLVAVWLVMRPRPVREIRLTVLTLIACEIGGALVLPMFLRVVGAAPPGGEYGGVGVLRYFAFLQFTDVRRVLYIAVPCGLAPLVALLWWKRQDDVARAITLVTCAYFLFFFVQARIALHHFIPAMLLPVIVYWRMATTVARRDAWRWGALAGAGAALLLATPRHWAPHRTGKLIGETIAEKVGVYADVDPAVFRHSTLLSQLFPLDWDPAVPTRSYGGSPLVWMRYASHDSVPREANYALVRLADAPPPGMHRVAADDGAALYVRSDSLWAQHRASRPASPVASWALDVPRGILFLHAVPLEHGPRIISMPDVLAGMGVDVDALMNRLGVKKRA